MDFIYALNNTILHWFVHPVAGAQHVACDTVSCCPQLHLK